VRSSVRSLGSLSNERYYPFLLSINPLRRSAHHCLHYFRIFAYWLLKTFVLHQQYCESPCDVVQCRLPLSGRLFLIQFVIVYSFFKRPEHRRVAVFLTPVFLLTHPSAISNILPLQRFVHILKLSLILNIIQRRPLVVRDCKHIDFKRRKTS